MDGFLDELETLTHRARMRRMVQVGRDVAAGSADARARRGAVGHELGGAEGLAEILSFDIPTTKRDVRIAMLRAL